MERAGLFSVSGWLHWFVGDPPCALQGDRRPPCLWPSRQPPHGDSAVGALGQAGGRGGGGGGRGGDWCLLRNPSSLVSFRPCMLLRELSWFTGPERPCSCVSLVGFWPRTALPAPA